MRPQLIPRVRVAVIVNSYHVYHKSYKAQGVLVGKRKIATAEGEWWPPVDYLKFGETPAQAAIRTVKEETGLIFEPYKENLTSDYKYTNDIVKIDDKHYLTIFIYGSSQGEPTVMKPEKYVSWQWNYCDDNPLGFLPWITLCEDKYYEKNSWW